MHFHVLFRAQFHVLPLGGAALLTDGDADLGGVEAEAGAHDGEPGSPQQGAHRGAHAVDLQDVRDAGVHPGAEGREGEGQAEGLDEVCIAGERVN